MTDYSEKFEKMRIAGNLAAKTLDMLTDNIKEGISTDYIDKLGYEFIRDNGGYSAPLYYRGYPKSCCTSPNHTVCHGIPSDKILRDGDIVSHTFRFTNSGEAPLIISKATAACGCTVPQWPKQPIPVGGSGEIQVQFDSSNKPGMQNKVVTITANTESKVKKLLIRAQVNPRS